MELATHRVLCRLHRRHGRRLRRRVGRRLSQVQEPVKDFTERRLGVWYAKRFFASQVYDIVAKKWKNVSLQPKDHLVFLEDRCEGDRNPGHILYIKGQVCWHPRVNNARWNKKFER